ncbi:MAG: chromosome partitioning protein ParB [Chthonomonas sp.]|nr:chromosome partitioning protein ParB [Chthonomonas sp.]
MASQRFAKYKVLALEALTLWDRNYRQGNVEIIRNSILRFGFNSTVRVRGGVVYAGNHSVKALLELQASGAPPPPGIEVSRGRWMVPCMDISHLSEEEAMAFAIADNRASDMAVNDDDALAALLSEINIQDPSLLADTGFSGSELDDLLAALNQMSTPDVVQGQTGTLAERWLMAPFSVLNARSGEWQRRKAEWLATGIDSGAGRDAHLIGGEGKTAYGARVAGRDATTGELVYAEGLGGTSLFDPVLAEIAVKWFSGEGATVLDPFAGGSVRGVVAARLGRNYVGIDLRPEQVAENERQASGMGIVDARWVVGDSREILRLADGVSADLLFSCPPYGDLEQYSDDPRDLSAVSWEEFLVGYRQIICDSCSLLKDDRFAVLVVGEIRDKQGNYRGLVPETIRAFEDAGLAFYNEAILVTQVGTLQFRINRQFEGARKLGKTHQNVLVFLKGDAKRASQAAGVVELPEEELVIVE